MTFTGVLHDFSLSRLTTHTAGQGGEVHSDPSSGERAYRDSKVGHCTSGGAVFLVRHFDERTKGGTAALRKVAPCRVPQGQRLQMEDRIGAPSPRVRKPPPGGSNILGRHCVPSPPAALSGSNAESPGFPGGWLLWAIDISFGDDCVQNRAQVTRLRWR